jgi:hypothetical protein
MGPALLLIAQMYRVEKQARSLTAPERLWLGQLQSRPILDKLHGYLLEIGPMASCERFHCTVQEEF